jgi:hypothetical protein
MRSSKSTADAKTSNQYNKDQVKGKDFAVADMPSAAQLLKEVLPHDRVKYLDTLRSEAHIRMMKLPDTEQRKGMSAALDNLVRFLDTHSIWMTPMSDDQRAMLQAPPPSKENFFAAQERLQKQKNSKNKKKRKRKQVTKKEEKVETGAEDESESSDEDTWTVPEMHWRSRFVNAESMRAVMVRSSRRIFSPCSLC